MWFHNNTKENINLMFKQGLYSLAPWAWLYIIGGEIGGGGGWTPSFFKINVYTFQYALSQQKEAPKLLSELRPRKHSLGVEIFQGEHAPRPP